MRVLWMGLLVACGQSGKVGGDSGGTTEPGTTPTTSPTTTSPTTTSPTATTSPTTTSTTSPTTTATTSPSTTTTTTPPTLGPLPLCINEFMPGNDRSLEVEGLFPDWIELHNPTADAVDLDGWTVSDDEDEPEKHELDGGMVLEPGGFLLLYADALPYLGPQHLDFRLTGKGEVVALYAPDGRGSVVRYGEIADDLAAARASDCCEELDCWTFPFAGTPGETNEVVVPVTEEVFPEGRLWRFLDTGGGPPPGWRSPGFDDSGWDLGDAPLGYGDGHIVTEVDYGGDAGDKYVTTYFRYGFAVTDVDRVIGAAVRVLRDDGVVVYLNGTEVLRSNLPGGDLDSETMALDAASGAEETVFFRFDVDEALLVEGANVFAAEVHQATSGSSDLGFDLSFEVDRLP